MIRMDQGARIIIEQWVCAKKDDVIHLISDETKQEETKAFVETIVKGIEAAIKAIGENENDISTVEGHTH